MKERCTNNAISMPPSPFANSISLREHESSTASSSVSSANGSSHNSIHQNFISLLQYKDAYHILNLNSTNTTPENISKSYETCKQQTLKALEHCEAMERKAFGDSGRTNSFFMSQKNYLELKLQALDQAHNELLPIENIPQNVKLVEVGDTDKNATGTEAPKELHSAEPEQKMTTLTLQTIAPSTRKEPLEDEVDTIDVYFRNKSAASPPLHSYKSSTNRPISDIRNRSPSDHSVDVSSVSWEGSSIYSKREEASDGELTELLGPINNPRRTPSPLLHMTSKISSSAVDRSPLIPKKKTSQRITPPTVSPRSIKDFPTSSDDVEHDRKRSIKRRSGNKSHASYDFNNLLSSEATEAARKGVLRALSEDDSECLPLEEEDDDNQSAVLRALEASLNLSHISEQPSVLTDPSANENEIFVGKSDRMPMENNSIIEHVSNRELYRRESNIKASPGSKSSKSSKSKSLEHDFNRAESHYSTRLASIKNSSSFNRSTNNKLLAAPPPTKHFDEYYDSLLPSVMELADEFCIALNSCWNSALACRPDEPSGSNGDVQVHITGDCGEGHPKNLDRWTNSPDLQEFRSIPSPREEETSRASIEDGYTSFNIRDTVHTDGDSTAFDTTSSFSKNPKSTPSDFFLRKRLDSKKMLV